MLVWPIPPPLLLLSTLSLSICPCVCSCVYASACEGEARCVALRCGVYVVFLIRLSNIEARVICLPVTNLGHHSSIPSSWKRQGGVGRLPRRVKADEPQLDCRSASPDGALGLPGANAVRCRADAGATGPVGAYEPVGWQDGRKGGGRETVARSSATVCCHRVGSRGWRIDAEMVAVVLSACLAAARPRPTWAAQQQSGVYLASLRRAQSAALGSLGGGGMSRAKH